MNEWTRWTGVTNSARISAGGAISPGLIEVLTKHGKEGATWRDFRFLPWQATFDDRLLHKAMGQLASKNGYPIECKGIQGKHGLPERYRLKPI